MVGAGPNGLAAAVTLAEAGRSVLVLEARDTIGGGTRTAELTLPGFRHDVCSAIHPLVAASPFFESLELELDLVHSPAAVAHPLDNGSAALARRSLEDTAASLGVDYPILSDPTKEVARAYGVLAPSGMASRWTFYIGADGRILDIDKAVRAASHGADIAKRLEELNA